MRVSRCKNEKFNSKAKEAKEKNISIKLLIDSIILQYKIGIIKRERER